MKEKLPIIMVTQRKEDIKLNVPSGNVTFLEPFTDEVRSRIFTQCTEIKNNIQKIEEKEIPCIGKVIMKEKAIAKTHKPNNLFNDKTCPMIGTGKLNEIYIKITSDGINNLENEIKNTNAKVKTAEMTKIEKIEIYNSDDVLKINQEKVEEPLKIKLFDYKNEEYNKKNTEIFMKKIKELEIGDKISKLNSYKTMEVYSLKCADYEKIKQLSEYQGIKSIDVFQKYSLVNPKIKKLENMEYTFPKPIEGKEYPIVGLIDSGISEDNKEILPWIYKKEELVPKEYQNNSHATFIAGIMLLGEKLNFNLGDIKEPNFKILDVVAIPNTDEEYVFLEGIENIMKKYSDKVKVWNMSLGTDIEVEDMISDFAIELDRIQDEYGVQIFIAAGNFQNALRRWPTDINYNDRVTTPADSIRGIAVGSIALDKGVVDLNEPSPFSRRGPGANYINKPDIVDYGGNINEDGSIDGCGIVSFDLKGNYVEGIGTSYSTPFATIKYQNILNMINNENSLELSKALLIHSCVNPITKEQEIMNEDIPYFGFGIPERDLDEILKCDNSKVTIIIQGTIRMRRTH